jgi:hypothetical protein
MNIEIIDNFLDKEYFKFLNNEFLNSNFPWYFQKGKVFENDGNFQYTHLFFENNKTNSNYFNLIEPFLLLLSVKSLVKVKLNLTHKETIFKKFDLHTDVDFDCNTAVFYLNKNNGKTVFKNGKEVESIENRIVIFPSNLEHTGTTHTDTSYRMVLNLNYF